MTTTSADMLRRAETADRSHPWAVDAGGDTDGSDVPTHASFPRRSVRSATDTGSLSPSGSRCPDCCINTSPALAKYGPVLGRGRRRLTMSVLPRKQEAVEPPLLSFSMPVNTRDDATTPSQTDHQPNGVPNFADGGASYTHVMSKSGSAELCITGHFKYRNLRV